MRTQPPPKHAHGSLPEAKNHLHVITLGLIVILALALRIYHLGSASLWSDEVFSRYYADLFGLRYLLTDGLSREPTPPTYYLLLQFWMSMWGASETALRSLSVVGSTLCVPMTYLLGRELLGRKQGMAGALLFALCPMSIYFAQEARVYAFLMLVSCVVLWAAAIVQRDPGSVKGIVVYIVFATLSIYLHATGVLFVGACGVSVWLFLLAKGQPGREALLQWTAMNVCVLLLGSPYLIHAAAAGRTGGLDWVPPASAGALAHSAATVVTGVLTPYPRPAVLLAAAVFITFLTSVAVRRLSLPVTVTLVAVPSLFVLLLLVVSISRPILLPRVLAWTVVPFCLVAASQVFASGRWHFYFLLSLVAAFGTGLFFQFTTPGSDKEPWREAVHAVAPELAHADLVVMSPLFDPMVLTYYAPQVTDARLWDASLRPTIMDAAAARLQISRIRESDIMQAIQAKRSVWILSNSIDIPRLKNLETRMPGTFYREWSCGKVPCIAVAAWGKSR
jgi:mannosyltransferase